MLGRMNCAIHTRCEWKLIREKSFFYVKNFGIDQNLVDDQFTLAKNFFELPVSEKEKYEVDYA